VAREAGDWERVTHLGNSSSCRWSFVAETSNEAMALGAQVTASRAPSALLNRAEADTLSTTPLPQAGLALVRRRG